MPSSTELRWIIAYLVAGAVACGGSQSEDFFASAPPHLAAGASPGGAGSSAGSGAAAGSDAASGGSAGSAVGSGGDTSGVGGGGGVPASAGTSSGVGAGAGMPTGAAGDGNGTGGSGGVAGVAGSPGAGAGGTPSVGGMAGLGAGGGDAGSPAAGGQPGRGGQAGTGGSGPMQCGAVLTTANKALEAAQACNLAVSSLECLDLVDTPCGCKVPVAKLESMATKTYLAALKALDSCPISCTEALCQNPTSGHCERDSGSIQGHCVGDDANTF